MPSHLLVFSLSSFPTKLYFQSSNSVLPSPQCIFFCFGLIWSQCSPSLKWVYIVWNIFQESIIRKLEWSACVGQCWNLHCVYLLSDIMHVLLGCTSISSFSMIIVPEVEWACEWESQSKLKNHILPLSSLDPPLSITLALILPVVYKISSKPGIW